ncbi:MAG: hypothetical protein NW215_15915 [Hyphomicrobiales bacterium]|nr:hypothetical protein [Hyphomicrobiales bacterium]
MLKPKDKRLALEKLRQRFSATGLAYAACDQPRLDKSLFDVRLFANGLHEVACETPRAYAAAMAFALAAAGISNKAGKPLLMATLAGEAQEHGSLYGPGLQALGIDPARLCMVTVDREKELLWAAEEAASCAALGAVVVVLARREKLYGFTVSRRLKLRQEKSGVPLFIVRQASSDATAATARWHIACLPSRGVIAPHSSVPLVGAPRFSVRRDACAGLPPQTWEVELDASMGVRMAAPLSDRPAGAAETRNRSAA